MSTSLVHRDAWMGNIRALLLSAETENLIIATWAAPKLWNRFSVVRELLESATTRRPDKVTILVGLPQPSTDDFSWYLSSVFEVADTWKRIDWRVCIGAHQKFVYAKLGRSIFGMIGSVNFTDSAFHDLGLYVPKGMNSSFERHVRTCLIRATPITRFKDPRQALPNDWKASVMAAVEPSEPTAE